MRRWLLPVLIALAATAGLPAAATSQQAQPRIIGGSPATIEGYPFQVRIDINSIGILTGSCGGVIRDATHVMTAAHCVTLMTLRTPVAPGAVTVHYGSADTTTQRAIGVSQITPAPQYQANENYDAALLTLAGPLEGYGGPQVNRIPFASAGELSAAIAAGPNGVASGWGRTDNNDPNSTTNQLQAVQLALRPDEVCSARYPQDFSPPLGVCAGGTGTAAENNPDTCNGDSGGPLAVSVNGVLKLAGLTSFGEQCGLPSTPGVYTETSNPEICSVLGGGLECLTDPRRSTAPPAAAVRDTTRPAARITSLRCRKRVCSFRVRTADRGGSVRSLSTRVYRRVRACRKRGGRRSCRTVMRNKKVRTKKIPRGYSGKTKLNVARYRLDAVATDRAGNRSKAARKRFKVKKR